LACGLNGIWWHIDDDQDVASVMGKYYQMLALTLTDSTPRRVWSYYRYGVTNQMDMMLCQSVYDRSKSPATLLGQLCISANLVEPYSKIMIASDFDAELLSMGQENLRCTSPKLNEVEMQVLRQEITPGGCGVCPTLSKQNEAPMCKGIPKPGDATASPSTGSSDVSMSICTSITSYIIGFAIAVHRY
jgi:hypothetical protein